MYGYPRSTVYDTAHKYAASEKSEEGSFNPARKIHAKKKTTRTPELVQRAQDIISEDPRISLRKLASILGVSDATIRRITQEDLRYTSYVIKVQQMLSDEAKAKRLACCNLLLRSLKNEATDRLKFFSDDKIFAMDVEMNQRNHRWLVYDPKDIFVVNTMKFPTSVRVLSVISSEGDIMPPYFFKEGENVTNEVYLKTLQMVVKPWIETVASGKPYIFQQNDAPPQTNYLVQRWLSDNVDLLWSKELWPPNSPDLNPLDYYVWSVIERVSNKSMPHRDVASLQATIEEAFAALDCAQLKIACSRFKTRIEAVIKTNGGYIM